MAMGADLAHRCSRQIGRTARANGDEGDCGLEHREDRRGHLGRQALEGGGEALRHLLLLLLLPRVGVRRMARTRHALLLRECP